MSRLSNSSFLSTLGVLAAGGVFAYAIYSFYPSSGSSDEAVPVIKAEATPIKIEPVRTGGMDIPFQDSTVYDSMRRAENTQATRIENLLEPAAGDEEPMSREEIVAKVEEQTQEKAINITESIDTPDEDENFIAPEISDGGIEEGEAALMAEMAEELPQPEADKSVKNILDEEVNENVASSETQDGQMPSIHKPAASPETLAFVRSVLDKKDAGNALKSPETNKVGAVATKTEALEAKVAKAEPAKVEIQEIEPAAGTEGQIVTQGSHFVQLASITDRARANTEWTKLKEQLSAIPGASGFRVQEATLDKGTFFRIQAGPYSEAQAKSICDSIKMQKPGGCFVVK